MKPLRTIDVPIPVHRLGMEMLRLNEITFGRIPDENVTFRINSIAGNGSPVIQIEDAYYMIAIEDLVKAALFVRKVEEKEKTDGEKAE